ncbi:MAG: 4-hydroxythreonine-4-phosphate dehydrogenase PdxA [Candidatus Cloacimonetes bacterium]|nr:4-hydroxythreonine-4-phosphate dehydrogenase PdxA [Candidatus Cloacimonadota bacterium]MCF7815015.1 4-hydroxythreonine-4-phosphate dehydrogenase PdxA [Candidatus Cloacimonadota bacterium]MCF7859933.1 4-hydroxythreonine-4-phosphate dehydrogenase PdxA [Candidatus Cloacimonadota bacterium]MCF7869264.1 4-hydroxythreonine-4-phosphate dehydrogenase PdxA [Candidatus Cloacimonadota bacterium]
MRKLAITTGDPAGIGPEITSKALRFLSLNDNLIIIVYGKLYSFSDGNRIKKIEHVDQAIHPNYIYWIEIDDPKIKIGKPTKSSGEIAYKILLKCVSDLNHGFLDGVVTCPISKEAIHHSHPQFIGHTEFFADLSHTNDVIMSFWGPHFNLALLTTHLATKCVADKLTKNLIEKKLRIIFSEFQKFLSEPKFAILAMNPHAGEKGAFGTEDEVLKVILEKIKKSNIKIDGPFPADTFFAQHADKYDVIISAYHDQGLIPFKMISKDEGVNVTLGLPFVRTSVDHGTAFDIAGKNIASELSLLAAINLAEKMLKCDKKDQNNIYKNFAIFYDKYMAHVDYEKWIKFFLECFSQRFKRNPKKTLELACGTANIACELVKKGLDVDASDISSEMLKIAAKKTLRPNLFQHDMRYLLPVEKYELVLLLFDSLNYLIDYKEIEHLLENVYTTLKQNGLFIFDITTIKNCSNNFDGFVNLEDDQDSYLIHHGEYDEETSIQTTNLTFFKKKGFLFERFDEVHKQKVYNVTELVSIIEKSNFKLSAIHSIGFKENLVKSDLTVLDENFTRLFFVLEKK